VAQMARDRLLQDGNHAEAMAKGERGEDAALGDAEHRLLRHLAHRMQPRVAVAGDDERVVARLLLAYERDERRNEAVDMLLRLDARWAFLQRRRLDRRAAGHTQRLARLVD